MSTASSSNGQAVRTRGRAMRTALIAVTFVLGALAFVPLILSRFTHDPSEAIRAACQNNLKQLHLVLLLYSGESKGGLYPELSDRPGALAMKADTVYPEYLEYLEPLQCLASWYFKKWNEADPAPPAGCDDDQSYFYLGYLIPDQSTLEYFAQAYRARVAKKQPFTDGLLVPRDGSRELVIPRLRKDEDKSPATPDGEAIKRALPIFIERFPNGHKPAGGHVVYADGRVEWIRWGQRWPMTPEAMDVLLALDALGATNSSAD